MMVLMFKQKRKGPMGVAGAAFVMIAGASEASAALADSLSMERRVGINVFYFNTIVNKFF
jgi:hypothetical protein